MSNQSIITSATVYLSRTYFHHLLKDISLILQQKPNGYLLEPQFIFPQHHITLLNSCKNHTS